MTNFTTIVFDWAGVFCTPGEPFSHPKLQEALQRTSLEEIERRVRIPYDEYYRGKRTAEAFWQDVVTTLQIESLPAQDCTRAYLDSYQIFLDHLDIPLRLKQTHTVALLSNLTEEMMRHVLIAHQLDQRFHHLFFSNRTGFLKPERAAFAHALETLRAQPEATLFIDDSRKNVEAAEALGMRAIHLRDPSLLPQELRSLGVDF